VVLCKWKAFFLQTKQLPASQENCCAIQLDLKEVLVYLSKLNLNIINLSSLERILISQTQWKFRNRQFQNVLILIKYLHIGDLRMVFLFIKQPWQSHLKNFTHVCGTQRVSSKSTRVKCARSDSNPYKTIKLGPLCACGLQAPADWYFTMCQTL
jgi:hypothetical protein